MRNLSIISPKTIRSFAELKRQYPNCGDNLSDSCRPFFVEHIAIMRSELGSGKVVKEDIDVVLRDKYEKAKKAAKALSK